MIEQQNNLATRLLRGVLAKAGLEIGFICVIATLAAFHNASPLLRGAVDIAEQRQVGGWAYDPLAPDSTIDVQLFIDERFIATQRAEKPRVDLVEAGATPTANHGFNFDLTTVPLTAGSHTAQVYVLRTAAGKNKALIPLSQSVHRFQVTR